MSRRDAPDDANTAALQRASRRSNLRTSLARFTPAGLRRALADVRVPSATTPWSWSDDGGLYWGEGGAWLYLQVPTSVLDADRGGLDDLLNRLARAAGGRSVHLAVYTWEDPALVPAGVTASLHQYLQESLTLLVPAHCVVIGVQLSPAPASERSAASVRGVTSELIDKSLAEWVPDFTAFDDDRSRIVEELRSCGATPVSGRSRLMLEAWWTLGISQDVEAHENNDSISFHGTDGDRLEFVALRSFDDVEPTHLSSLMPGEGGVLVCSVRGLIEEHTPAGSSNPQGRIGQSSILLGRRSARGNGVLQHRAADLPGIECKPLTMAQLPALDETLPCSKNRLEPHLYRVEAGRLRRVGFDEPTPGGDRRGLHAGLVDPDYAYPLWLDLVTLTRRRLTVVGRVASGKTFLARHLATQAHLNGTGVQFVRSAVRDLLDGSQVFDTPTPGLLDPFRHLPAAVAAPAAAIAVGTLVSLSDDERALVADALRRASSAGVETLQHAIRLLPEPRLQARVIAALSTPAGKLLYGTGAEPVPGTAVWDTDAICAGFTDVERQLIEDLVVATAATAATGGLLVVDDVPYAETGTISALVEAEVTTGGVVQTARPRRGLSHLATPSLTNRVILLSLDLDHARSALHLLGEPDVSETATFLTGSGPVLRHQSVRRAATGVLFEQPGTPGKRIAIAPVPVSSLPAFTNGRASKYPSE